MASTSSWYASASDSCSIPTRWDVFLSFRGPDTRYKFTSHLYSALDRHGIRTFKDDPELRSGEVISDSLLQAIKESKTYIVVFSENYAHSPWCLDELLEIYNCHKTSQRLVIPVFYDIDPSVVRHQIGSFEENFKKHQVRFAGEMKKVDNWKFALTHVAGFSGAHVSENRSEADIINEIVDEILLEINPKTLDVAKYPVGLDSCVKDIITLLSSVREGVIRFGIYGMGGVGKTTLAKALYNQLLLQRSFKDSCFLANCREVSGTTKGLASLQQQLVNDVLKSKKIITVDNVDKGIRLIGARLCSTKVLVVIDDLDHHEQFECLVGPFASGSVVIVTTRDEEILDKIEVKARYRYRVNELNYEESLALLTHHAFRNAKPSNTFMDLCEKILHHAGGLPLALEVFGSYLYKQTDVGWKSFIEKLQRNPDSSIQKRLLISLNALESEDPMLKKIFLDIACFFIGKEKQEAIEVLGTYYAYADHSIDILKKRCLLTVNREHELRMHDLLRDMGRDIAQNDFPCEPGKHSRLWVQKDVYEVLMKRKGTEAVQVILPNISSDDERVSVTTETFKMMSKLRFLRLTYAARITGSFEQIFEDLRWLSWDGCPLTSFPFEFYPPKLVFLELPGSKLRTMQGLNMVFENLKDLDMSGSLDLTSTPDFTKLPCLETLNLENCRSLEEVHISIGILGKLAFLNLGYCMKLKSLPGTLCKLSALEVLNIGYCSSLEALPIELGNIGSLKALYMWGLAVSEIPNSVGQLHDLVTLKLSDNRNLRTLPDSICSLRSLKILDISTCEMLERIPDKFWNLTKLRELHACATSLKKVPDILESSQAALSNLEYLNVSGNGLTALPYGIGQHINLTGLTIEGSVNLLSIDELPPNLAYIYAKGCKSLERLPNLSDLKHLKILDLTNCSSLTEIHGLTKLTNLDELYLGGCNSSFLACTVGEHFFKVYSGCRIYVSEVPYWISDQSGYKKGSKVFVDLVPDMSHNFLGLVLCFKGTTTTPNFIKYTVKNTTSGYKCEKQVYSKSLELFMVMLPRSIFWVSNGDDKLEVESDTNICGMHLLYKRESKTRKKLPPPDNKNEVEAGKLASEDETQYATMLNALKTHSVGLQRAVETGDYLLAQGHQRFISTLAIALSKQMMAQILSSRGSTTITLAFSGESSKNDKGKPVAVETKKKKKKRGKDDNYRKGMR